MLSDYVRIFVVAWLLLALVSDWPAYPAPGQRVPLRQFLRVVIEIVALFIIAIWPFLETHVR